MTQSTAIELGESPTIVQVAELHRAICAGFPSGTPFIVDGSRVAQIDTAVLQLLASLWASCERRGTACTWHGSSAALVRAAHLIGLAESLRLPCTDASSGRHAAA
jgi:anti-anti-sigma regulatory factor